MKKYFITVIGICIGMIALLCGCGPAPLTGGNSSQTGNSGVAVAASGKFISGTTIPRARVSIFETAFKPYLTPSGFCDSTVADDSGKFSFSPSLDGYYNLVVFDPKQGGAAFVAGIPAFVDSAFSKSIDTLRQPGFIAGTAQDSAGAVFALSYIYIDGSPFYTVTKNNGDFLLGPLPPGTYTTGLFANFMVANLATGEIAQMSTVKTDTVVVTVAPGSTSAWNW